MITKRHASHPRMPVWVLALYLVTSCPAGYSKDSDADWNWRLPKDDYKQLNQFERAQYNKAAKLYERGEESMIRRHRRPDVKAFNAAASEWEKFRVQFPNSSVLPYVVFMQAHSLHFAKNRNSAIKVYTEVLDYFGDEIWVAAPALYWRGIAHFDNGDVRDGMKDMKAMMDDPDYRLHSLAAGALRRLADNHARNAEMQKAVHYWKQAYELFRESNPPEAATARDKVIGFYVRSNQYGQIESWLLEDKERSGAKARVALSSAVRSVALDGFKDDWGTYTGIAGAKQKEDDIQAFLAWFTQQKPWYQKNKTPWSWYTQILYFTAHRYRNCESFGQLIDEATQLTKTADLQDKEKDDRYEWLVDRCREAQKAQQGRLVAGLMTDRNRALWKTYELTGYAEGKWKDAVSLLEQLQATKDRDWSRKALSERAKVYHQRLGQYEDAIKLYQEVNAPPETLWQIQDCYRRWGKTDKALSTLGELIAMFPGEAAQAMYQKGYYLHKDGELKKAISAYRQVLQHPQWKKSGAASKAHQRLEELGIDTGGGVIHED